MYADKRLSSIFFVLSMLKEKEWGLGEPRVSYDEGGNEGELKNDRDLVRPHVVDEVSTVCNQTV